MLSFWKKGNTIEASKALKDAEKCCEKTSDQTLLKDIYRELTILNCEIGASDLALQYAHKQLSAARKDGDNRRRKIKRALQTENSLLSETNKKLSESETELGKENSTMRKRVDCCPSRLRTAKNGLEIITRIENNNLPASDWRDTKDFTYAVMYYMSKHPSLIDMIDAEYDRLTDFEIITIFISSTQQKQPILLRRGNKNCQFCCVEEIKWLYLQKKNQLW